MAEVELRRVRKTYIGGIEAVKGIDLRIVDGELCVLVGPSGCGKSTLLRMVAGLETITEGEIKIDGEIVNRREPAERDIAMVFQNYALYPHMTVYNNMAYGLKNRGFQRSVIEQKVREAARILAIEELLDRRPRQLSGGQRQRVAMGRAIVRDPKVFLFDEPLSNLDAKLRVQMRIEIRKLQQSLGTTSIYVTHDQLEAMTLGDVLVVMNEGRVEQIGRPLEVYERPETAFVAAFIGSPAMNLIPIRRAAGGGVTLEDGTKVAVPADMPVPEAGALLGIRPEDLSENGAGDTRFELEVEAVEALGAESFIYGQVGGGKQGLVMRAAGKRRHPPGARISASAPATSLHLFDLVSGQRRA